VGLQDPSGDTSARVEETARRLVQRLAGFLQPVYPGLIHSVEEARQAGRLLRAEEVDGVLLSPLMWCEDRIVRAALGEMASPPLLLWTYSPEARLPEFVPFQRMIQGSGAVCTLQLSGLLRREGYRCSTVVGHGQDPAVYRQIEAQSRAMAVSRRLRSLRVGLLPFPCDQMSTTYVDEFELRRRYGVELRYLELERFRRTARETPEADLAALRWELEAAGHEIRVDEHNLTEGLRYALALERVLRAEGLEVLAMNDVIAEMHASFGLRPCLYNPRLCAAGAVIAMEADIAAALGMYVLRQLTGHSPMYTEPFSIDHEDNALLLGHAGYHDAANADPAFPVQIVSDVEYENSDPFSGAVSFFKYRPGPVTMVNSVWDGEGLKWVACEGESLPGPPKMEGNSHLYCRLGLPVKEFFRSSVDSGVSQHWIVVPGHIRGELPEPCRVLGIRFEGLPDF
jgi:L-arabinose isomerase